MLYREIIAVCSQIHTKHINTLCGQNVELLNIKPGPGGRAVWAMGLRPLAFWDCGFKSHQEACMFVACEYCVLSGRVLCDGPIPRPEESDQVLCVWVWSGILDINETLAQPTRGCRSLRKKIINLYLSLIKIVFLLLFFVDTSVTEVNTCLCQSCAPEYMYSLFSLGWYTSCCQLPILWIWILDL